MSSSHRHPIHLVRALAVLTTLALVACDPAPEPGDVGIQNVEVTQGIQNVLNQVPLLAGRPTFVRVYLRGNTEGGAAVPAVTARMYIDGGAVLAPRGTASVVAPARGSDPRVLGDSFLFEVPTAELPAGAHRIRVALELPAGVTVSDPANLVSELDITMQPPQEMTVYGITYGYTNIPRAYQLRLGLTSSTWQPRPFTDFELQRDGAEQMLPLSALVVDPLPDTASPLFDCRYTGDDATGGCAGYEDARTWGTQVIDARFPAGGENLVILQPETTPGRFLGGHVGTGRRNGVINMQPDTSVYIGATLAHELFHALGVGHTAMPLDGFDPKYPRPDGSLGAYVGLRSRPTLELYAGDTLAGAVAGYDIMSYRFPQWASPWTYCKALNAASRGAVTCPHLLDDWDR